MGQLFLTFSPNSSLLVSSFLFWCLDFSCLALSYLVSPCLTPWLLLYIYTLVSLSLYLSLKPFDFDTDTVFFALPSDLGFPDPTSSVSSLRAFWNVLVEVKHCIAWHCMALLRMIWLGMVWHGLVWHCMARHLVHGIREYLWLQRRNIH